MTDFYDPGKSPSRWARWLKLAVCVAVVALLAAAFWFRWIPGRPVSAEWARGGSSPDNSLSYEVEEDVPTSGASDDEAISSSNFLFTMGEGAGLRGYDVIQVRPDGRCVYTYSDIGPVSASRPASRPTTAPGSPTGELARFRRATFSVSPQVVADLRRLLVDIDYFNMKKSYRTPPSATAVPTPAAAPADKAEVAPDAASTPMIADGTQWFVRVHAGPHEKAVWCDNHFPRQLIKLNDFVRDQIVEPNAGARSLAAPIELPVNWFLDLEIPRSGPDAEPVGE